MASAVNAPLLVAHGPLGIDEEAFGQRATVDREGAAGSTGFGQPPSPSSRQEAAGILEPSAISFLRLRQHPVLLRALEAPARPAVHQHRLPAMVREVNLAATMLARPIAGAGRPDQR